MPTLYKSVGIFFNSRLIIMGRRLANYSHLGNEIFPHWEQIIPTLGIIDK